MITKLTQLDPEPPWTVLSGLGTMVGMFIAMIIGATLAQIALEGSSDALVMVTGFNIGLTLTAVFVVIMRWRTAEESQALGMGATPAKLRIIFTFSLGAAGTLDLISWVVTGNRTLATAELLNFDVTMAISGWVMALLLLVVLQPVAEELVFRGILFPALRVNFGPWFGLLMCAALYAAFHLMAYLPEGTSRTVFIWYGLALPFLDGLVISSVRALTGSTRMAIVTHTGLGLFAVFKAWILVG